MWERGFRGLFCGVRVKERLRLAELAERETEEQNCDHV